MNKGSYFNRGKLSLAVRLLIGVGLVMLIVGSLMVIMVLRADIKMEKEQFSRRASEQADFIRMSITEMALVGDYATIRQMLRSRVQDEALDRITWSDDEGKTIKEESKELLDTVPEWFVQFVGITPIIESSVIEVGGAHYGVVTIQMSPTSVVKRIYGRMLIGIESTVFAMVILFSLIAIVTARSLGPLKLLEAAAQEIEKGNYSVRVTPGGSSEVRGPIMAFNAMATQIEVLLGQMRKLAGRMEKAREEQNKSIARELHDSLGGNLTMLKLGLGRLSEIAGEDHKCQPKIKSLLDLSDSTIHLVRDLTAALRPSMLDSLGVLPTIKWYAGEFSRMTGIECQVDLCKDAVCSKEHSTALFRVVQEALTNVARHSNASRVFINACEEEGKLVVEIVDNGKGMAEVINKDVSNGTNSFGIIGMRERTQFMQGEFDISSVPGRGTTVAISIPIGKT